MSLDWWQDFLVLRREGSQGHDEGMKKCRLQRVSAWSKVFRVLCHILRRDYVTCCILEKNVNSLGVAPQDAIVTTRSSHCITFFEAFTPKEYDDVFVRIPFQSRCFFAWWFCPQERTKALELKYKLAMEEIWTRCWCFGIAAKGRVEKNAMNMVENYMNFVFFGGLFTYFCVKVKLRLAKTGVELLHLGIDRGQYPRCPCSKCPAYWFSNEIKHLFLSAAFFCRRFEPSKVFLEPAPKSTTKHDGRFDLFSWWSNP